MTAKPPKVDFCLMFCFSVDLAEIPGLFVWQSGFCKNISVGCRQSNLLAPTAALIPL